MSSTHGGRMSVRPFDRETAAVQYMDAGQIALAFRRLAFGWEHDRGDLDGHFRHIADHVKGGVGRLALDMYQHSGLSTVFESAAERGNSSLEYPAMPPKDLSKVPSEERLAAACIVATHFVLPVHLEMPKGRVYIEPGLDVDTAFERYIELESPLPSGPHPVSL